MTETAVPFMNLAVQHQGLEAEITEAVAPLLKNASFIGGDPVDRFEAAYASAHDIPYAVTVKSGTAALQLALEAMGVEPGDEVLVPAFTFIATAASVVRAGAKPVFVDVDRETACMDPAAAAAAMTPRTKVMIPVHLYGHPAPMDSLGELADKHGIKILEDCAQSHFGSWHGKRTGTMGAAGAFSFYPSKNLGAAGDAGCLITRDEKLANTVRQLANHGRTDRYGHGFLGWNERLDALQAAVLTVKLRHLDAWTASRREIASRYRTELEGLAPWGEPLRLPVEKANTVPVYHLYVVRHPHREDIATLLAKRGVGTATHYPMTVPAQPAFQRLGLGEGSFPESEAWARECLSLPLFPELTGSQQVRVAEALRDLPG